MKKLFSMLCLLITLFACSDSNSEQNAPETPIQDLQMPSSDIPLIENQLVTIQGKGFTSTSQIWLRASGTKAQGDIQAGVTQANEKSLTFKVPANTTGKKEIILKQDGKEYLLGTLTFKEKERYYAFCYNDSVDEFAEIDIESGNLIWTGLKIPEFGVGDRGYVFNESGSELVAFDAYGTANKPTIYRLNMATKEMKTTELKNLDGAESFLDIIRFNNKYYAFCYDKDKYEFAEIDIESGNLIWNGLKMPGFEISTRGYLFNENGSELVALSQEGDKLTVSRLNMVTKEVKTKEVKNQNGANEFSDIIRINDKYYTFCHDSDKEEFAEINIENGNLTWSNLKIKGLGITNRGFVFNERENQLIALGPVDKLTVYRLNMATKEVKIIKVKKFFDGAKDFRNIAIRK